METIIFTEASQLEGIEKAKLKTILPVLQTIAKQTGLKLSKLSDFNRCKRILRISILNN